MWTPPNNSLESFSPSEEFFAIGSEYTCELVCPEEQRHRTYQLRVMDEAAFSSGDEARAATSVLLADATLSADGILRGNFTPQAEWPASVRVGFIDASGERFGLGGANVVTIA